MNDWRYGAPQCRLLFLINITLYVPRLLLTRPWTTVFLLRSEELTIFCFTSRSKMRTFFSYRFLFIMLISVRESAILWDWLLRHFVYALAKQNQALYPPSQNHVIYKDMMLCDWLHYAIGGSSVVKTKAYPPSQNTAPELSGYYKRVSIFIS